MRWIPLQKAGSRRWRLCVLHDDCVTYDVTPLESEHVDKISLYAAYLNHGIDGGIERDLLEELDDLKKQYGSDQKFPQ